VLVVAEDRFGGSGIDIRQLPRSVCRFRGFPRQDYAPVSPSHPLQPFFSRPAHGGRDRLPGSCGKLARGFFGCSILDIQRHGIAQE
jgi:hypothetical protein